MARDIGNTTGEVFRAVITRHMIDGERRQYYGPYDTKGLAQAQVTTETTKGQQATRPYRVSGRVERAELKWGPA